MRPTGWLATSILVASNLVQTTHAIKLLESHALVPCSNDGTVSVNRFEAVFTPNNETLMLGLDGSTAYSGKVMVDVELLAYGYNAISKTVDPCTFNVYGFCPMKPTTLNIPTSPLTNIPQKTLKMIPAANLYLDEDIAYTMPDIDAIVRLTIKDATTNAEVGCVEARVSNGRTVDQAGVGWVLAIITGFGLVGSAVLSTLEYSNIATNLAFRSLLIFGFMQSQAMVGMTAVDQPPLVQSWTQNFQWTMGILHTGALQNIATWFQRATGGTSLNLASKLNEISVVLAKRSSSAHQLASRSTVTTSGGTELTLRGIERVGFRADIAPTNIFMTGYLFFYFIALLMIVCIAILKFALPVASKKVYNEKLDRAVDASADWRNMARGYLYRLVALGYPQMCVLCFWEFYHHDSAAEIILALSMWLVMSVLLGWATFQVVRRARRSQILHRNLAYALYSDPAFLSRWGFLYVNYRAQVYYLIVPFLAYTAVKGLIIALGQANPVAQSIVLLLFEAAYMVTVMVMRPYMDRVANGFGITVAVVNFVNAFFIFIFSDVCNQPALMTGIMGVLFFLYNAFFTLALLIFLLMGLYSAIRLQEPTGKYRRLSDDRNSFQSSHSRANSELLALGKIAQGKHTPSASQSDSTIRNSQGENSSFERSPFADSSDSTLHMEAGNPSHSLDSMRSEDISDGYKPARTDSP